MLSREEARRFYDRIGRRQDSQGFYEDAPLREMSSRADFAAARTVLEFGCGTGRFAVSLFQTQLPKHAVYLGLELSPVMAGLARRRLEPFADRAAVVLTNGAPSIPVGDGTIDRLVSNYVLDLLPGEDIQSFFADAHRALQPEGRICLTGLTWGDSGLSKVVSRAWNAIHRFKPVWVGGCRPLDMRDFLQSERWEILHCKTVVASGVPSQALVARPRPNTTRGIGLSGLG